MGLETLSGRTAGMKTGVRGAAWSVLSFVRNHPTSSSIAWTILLLTLCLAPERAMPAEDSTTYKEYFPHLDLVVHFSLFAGFAYVWTQAGRSTLRWVAVAVVGLILAVGTEYAQSFPAIDRDASVLDGLADSLGVVSGLVASAVVGRWFASSSTPPTR